MTGLDLLYDYAEQEKIFIYFGNVNIAPAAIIKDQENFNIALDTSMTTNETVEKTLLMHELAHIATGSFYKAGHDMCYKRKMENRATRWMIKLLIPAEDLDEAIRNGITEPWDLAEYFEVSEDFIVKAVEYYKVQSSKIKICTELNKIPPSDG